MTVSDIHWWHQNSLIHFMENVTSIPLYIIYLYIMYLYLISLYYYIYLKMPVYIFLNPIDSKTCVKNKVRKIIYISTDYSKPSQKEILAKKSTVRRCVCFNLWDLYTLVCFCDCFSTPWTLCSQKMAEIKSLWRERSTVLFESGDS